jgi:hypothetical protein
VASLLVVLSAGGSTTALATAGKDGPASGRGNAGRQVTADAEPGQACRLRVHPLLLPA